MRITLSPKQRDVLYDRLLDQLKAFNDLIQAVEAGDRGAAERLGHHFSDALRLIVDGLTWEERATGPVELSIPPDELRRIMKAIRDDAAEQHESERPEQEEFRRTYERTALVRDTCTEVLEQLRDVRGS